MNTTQMLDWLETRTLIVLCRNRIAAISRGLEFYRDKAEREGQKPYRTHRLAMWNSIRTCNAIHRQLDSELDRLNKIVRFYLES